MSNMTQADITNLIDASAAPGQWECPIDPQPEHWRKLGFLQWRAGITRGVPLSRPEAAYLAFMQALSTTPEFQDEAARHIVEFRLALRARRIEALKARASKMRAQLGDWSVPLSELAKHMNATPADTDAYRLRAQFEGRYGVTACRECWKEVRALEAIEQEIIDTQSALLGVVAAADDERRAARVAAAKAQQSGETPAAPAPKKKVVNRNAPVPV